MYCGLSVPQKHTSTLATNLSLSLSLSLSPSYLQRRRSMWLELLRHGCQDCLVQLSDSRVEGVNSIVTFLLSRALVPDGHEQAADGVSHCLGVGSKQLPHWGVIRVHNKRLGSSKQTGARLDQTLPSLHTSMHTYISGHAHEGLHRSEHNNLSECRLMDQ